MSKTDKIQELIAERDALARQLGAITAVVGSWESLPIDKNLGLVESIKAADVAFKRSCDEVDEAMEAVCGELLAAKKKIAELAEALAAREALSRDPSDSFAGIMDGPEMMPLGGDESTGEALTRDEHAKRIGDLP